MQAESPETKTPPRAGSVHSLFRVLRRSRIAAAQYTLQTATAASFAAALLLSCSVKGVHGESNLRWSWFDVKLQSEAMRSSFEKRFRPFDLQIRRGDPIAPRLLAAIERLVCNLEYASGQSSLPARHTVHTA